MTDADMIAYCRAQLQTIADQEREAERELARFRALLATLAGGRRAYEDVIAEIQRRREEA